MIYLDFILFYVWLTKYPIFQNHLKLSKKLQNVIEFPEKRFQSILLFLTPFRRVIFGISLMNSKDEIDMASNAVNSYI